MVLKDGVEVLCQTGAERSTTNNIMELRAALRGLDAVVARGWHTSDEVELVSDSRFTLEIANGTYLPRKDLDLARLLRAASVAAGATTRWVKGHRGDFWNERVDALADEAKQAQIPAKVRKKAERRRRL